MRQSAYIVAVYTVLLKQSTVAADTFSSEMRFDPAFTLGRLSDKLFEDTLQDYVYYSLDQDEVRDIYDDIEYVQRVVLKEARELLDTLNLS